MITEDYVSFKVAKLLKEKGFDEKCWGLYTTIFDDEDNPSIEYERWIERPHSNSFVCESFVCSAPSLALAMKWLREVHNRHIEIYRYPSKIRNSNGEFSKTWYAVIVILKSLDDIDEEFDVDYECNTYEEAAEAAIKYCLENLI